MISKFHINLYDLTNNLQICQTDWSWFNNYSGNRNISFKSRLNTDCVFILDLRRRYRPCILNSLPRQKCLNILRLPRTDIDILLKDIMTIRRDPKVIIPLIQPRF